MGKATIFVAFAMEDKAARDLLKGQALNTSTPFEYIDMSVKEAYKTEWKAKVRTRIKRSHGVIALITKNSLASTGQKWEIQCAREEGKPVLGMWPYRDDRTNVTGVNTKPWSYPNIAKWIDRFNS